MKTLVCSLLAIFAFSITNAQDPAVELEDVTVSSRNAHFLQTVQDENTPQFAIEVQNEAASYDLINSPDYRGNAKPEYLIEYKTDKGSMYTSYDPSGDIVRVLERYKDVALPKHLRDQIMEQYAGWSLENSLYTLVYKDDRIVKRFFKVRLKNGDSAIEVKLDLEIS